MATEEAIVVRGARKRYNDTPILDGLNMTVSRGTIYGLLGASGCGKTTLLSCIVGVRRLDFGDIWVLGGRPGSKGSGIPGPRVGYMPQEISLVKEFTAIEVFYYFGRINGLEDDVIKERYPFLSDLLQLPPKNRLVKNMSGGQQRRVSLAAALIHKPELLILDEPTVGLDPILRENIWNFLMKIAQEESTTVVITTHYIEEAKLSNKIGLMRCGKLLAEATPNQLLRRFQSGSLEEVFLILSRRQAEILDGGSVETIAESLPELEEITASESSLYNNNYNGVGNKVFKNNEQPVSMKEKSRTRRSAFRKFKALMTKNLLQFLRHPGGILFALVFPVIQTFLFFNAIGQDPKDLMIAVVNEEAGNCDYGRYSGNIIYMYDIDNETCDFVDLSCRFLRDFNDTVATKRFYSDLTEAETALRKGKVAGVMHFNRNFSKALQKRRDDQAFVTDTEIVESEIHVLIDTGNRQIGLHLQKVLYERFFEIFAEIMKECRISPKYAEFPLKFEEPIFGKRDQKYTSFMAPAFLLTATFFLATSVSSAIIISDRHEGVWDRSLVQGVSTAEILLAHLLTQLGVVIVQVTMSLCISFLHFNLECKGSMVVVISLTLLVGFCGMCYGFLISVICTNHTMANYISTGSFYPVILLCGCIWPIEGMPKILRWLSLSLPTTVPSIAMRGLLDKGYPIEEPQVYSGFLIASSWAICFIILCLIGLRSKTSL